VGASRSAGRNVDNFWVSDPMCPTVWSTKAVVKRQGRSSNKMPAAVREAVKEAVEEFGDMSAKDAANFVSVMEREGRIIEECWS